MKIQALQVGPIGTNCYIFCDEGAKVCGIVDPGGEPEVILDAVKKLGCTVDKILLTHGHYDHTGAVPALLRTLPPTAVYIHEADFDFPSPQLFPLKTELTQGALGGVSFYGEGDRITVGTLELQVLHTLFAGSCGRTDFPGGSMKAMMASLARLAALPGDYRVLPGHMEPSTLERERKTNPYMQMALREQG